MKETKQLPPYTTRLQPHVAELELAIRPLVDDLSSDIPSFNGAIMFITDRWHTGSAGAAAVVHTLNLSDDRLDFANTHIKNHRVDLTATTLGTTFSSKKSAYAPSRLNPNNHSVWGAYITPRRNNAAVLQFAFNTHIRSLPSELLLKNAWDKYSDRIAAASRSLITASSDAVSLSDILLLSTPVTPNAYVIKWDVTDSTLMVARHYPLFKSYLQALQQRVNVSVKKYGGHVATFSGDGQNIVINIPPTVDRASLSAIGAFGQSTAVPFVKAILRAHSQVASNHSMLGPTIRIGLGLGHTEQSQAGEETGAIFWDVAEIVESLPRGKTSYEVTSAARFALDLALQNK